MIKWGLLLLILPSVVMMGFYFVELNEVRACHLDGGHWNYLASECRSTPQRFVPWIERMPLLVNGGMLLSVVGLVMCMLGFYRGKGA